MLLHWKRCIYWWKIETIFIVALEKMHILVEDRKWVVWEAKHRFSIFGINIPNWLSKTIQRVCNLVFHILWELRVQITRIKQKERYLRLFRCPLYALFPMECSFPKVLQKYSLTQIKILGSLWNCKNCIKVVEKQQGVACKAKHKPCIFGLIIPSWL